MELIKVDENITMTSREIAELIGKQHAHVMRDIEDEASKLGEEISQTLFEKTYYVDKNNQNRKQYILTKSGTWQLLSRYDIKIRSQLIQRLNTLEIEEIQKNLLNLNKYYTVTRVQKQFKANFKWQELKSSSIALGYEIKKIPCPRYGEANAYHSDVWGHVYGIDL